MLKVSSPQPPMDENMPPMDNPMPMKPEMPPMDGNGEMDNMDNEIGNEPPMNDEGNMQDENNPYEADFDAGVDADEETDPKRFIQQLTGKLSQSLRKYNESLPKPDEDLCKYVANMVNKQASQGLSQDDTNDILSKLTSDDTNECRNRNMKQNIDEIFQSIIQTNDEDSYHEPIRNIGFRKKPFTAPNFN